jgi:cell division septation protein DedD
LAPLQTIRGAGRDIWAFIAWDGFHPRAQGPDEPPSFDADTNLHPDITHLDSTAITSIPRVDTQATAPSAQPMRADSAPPRTPTFTVQFAAVRSAQSAQDVAHELLGAGVQPHVVPSTVAGVTIYRVILGPFTTRAAADSAGLASGKPYWIYEGAP